ncbi:MAG: hypothetical protein M3N68_09320 [Actinomycetota bacterium]|nr:hypothetical protein [Actinomycetota bacterium]
MAALGRPFDPQGRARREGWQQDVSNARSNDNVGTTFNNGGQWAGRDINQVGRDQIYDYRQRHNYYDDDPDPFFEIASGRGGARAVVVVGVLIALAGFAMWMSFIFSGFGSDPSMADQGFPPVAIAGFALFGIGGVIASLGTAWSRAARRRQDGW